MPPKKRKAVSGAAESEGEEKGSMLSLRGSILLSAFFHAALFLALLLVSGAGQARAVYKPQYQVRLVRPQEVPALGKPQAKESATPVPVAPPEAAKPDPKPVVLPPKKEAPPPEKKVQKPSVEKKEPVAVAEAPKQPAPKAAPAEKPREPAPEEVLAEALARITKRAGSRQTMASNLPQGSPQGSSSGGSGWEERQKEVAYSEYYDRVERAVRGNWIPPQTLTNIKERSVMTVVSLTLLADGRVLRSYIEETSGNPQFDESVMRAILKSTPFPPPPVGLRHDRFELGLRFHSTPQTP